MKKFPIAVLLILCMTSYVKAEILLYEDFEYGRNADTIQDIILLSGNKWDSESQNGGGKIRVTDEIAHSGNRSARFQISTGKPTRLRHRKHYGNNFFVEFWIRPDSATNESDNNKLIYFLDELGQKANNTCIKVSQERHWWASNCSNRKYFRLFEKGWAIHYLGPGCATKRVGLYSEKVKLLRYDVWNRVVFHYEKSIDGVLIECWIDNGDGSGVEKAGVNKIYDDMECYNSRKIGGMDFGDMAGATFMIYYLDDIKVTTLMAP